LRKVNNGEVFQRYRLEVGSRSSSHCLITISTGVT